MTDPPPAATAAAADVLSRCYPGGTRAGYRDIARNVLAAALPHLTQPPPDGEVVLRGDEIHCALDMAREEGRADERERLREAFLAHRAATLDHVCCVTPIAVDLLGGE